MGGKVLKEIEDAIKKKAEELQGNKNYLRRLKKYDLEVEKAVLRSFTKERPPGLPGEEELKKELVARVEANISALKDIMTMLEGEIENSRIEIAILDKRKKILQEDYL